MATRFDLISLLFHFVLHIGVQSPFHATQSSQAELTMWYLCLLQLRITLLWSCMVPEFVATHVSTLQQAQLDVKLLKPSESIAVVRFCGVPLSTQQQTDRQSERLLGLQRFHATLAACWVVVWWSSVKPGPWMPNGCLTRERRGKPCGGSRWSAHHIDVCRQGPSTESWPLWKPPAYYVITTSWALWPFVWV